MAFEVYGIALPRAYHVLPRAAPSEVHDSPWAVQIPHTSKAMVQLLHSCTATRFIVVYSLPMNDSYAVEKMNNQIKKTLSCS